VAARSGRTLAINTKFQTQTIRTPEGVVFSLRLAGPVTRLLAWQIDFFTIGLLSTVGYHLAKIVSPVSRDFAGALGIIIYFSITFLYSIGLEWFWNGQTPGKRLLRLRVVEEGGRRLRFSQIAVRNLLRFIDMLPLFYLVGGITALVSPHAQRLGDIAAGTIVVRIPNVNTPDIEEIAGGKYNSFREHPYLEARLRSAVSPYEASLALSALMRRNELDDEPRLRLFRALAGRFKEFVDFPADITEDISDEQFVRNAVAGIYR